MKNLFKKFKKLYPERLVPSRIEGSRRDILIFGVAVAIAAVALALFRSPLLTKFNFVRTALTPAAESIETLPTSDVKEQISPTSDVLTSDVKEIPTSDVGDWSFWVDSEGRFSFSYPSEFSVTAFEEEGGEMVLAQGPNGKSFQIFIAPFEEGGPITVDRIKKDLPRLKMEELQEVSIAGVPALAFFSEGEGRRTREAWFVKGGYLYQVTAFFQMDELLSRIMKTFKF